MHRFCLPYQEIKIARSLAYCCFSDTHVDIYKCYTSIGQFGSPSIHAGCCCRHCHDWLLHSIQLYFQIKEEIIVDCSTSKQKKKNCIYIFFNFFWAIVLAALISILWPLLEAEIFIYMAYASWVNNFFLLLCFDTNFQYHFTWVHDPCRMDSRKMLTRQHTIHSQIYVYIH